MDGANMNAIAGIIDLGARGGYGAQQPTQNMDHFSRRGAGRCDYCGIRKACRFSAGETNIQRRLRDLPLGKPKLSIGSFHRHWGNFGHKVRAFAFLRLGKEGVPRMASTAVLSSRYLFATLRKSLPTLPACEGRSPECTSLS